MASVTRDLRLLKRATRWLLEDDPEFVQEGCADVSLLLTLFCVQRRIPVKLVTGWAVFANNERFNHVWLIVHGQQFDPTYWVQRIKPLEYVRARMPLAHFFGIERDSVDWRLPELEAALNTETANRP